MTSSAVGVSRADATNASAPNSNRPTDEESPLLGQQRSHSGDEDEQEAWHTPKINAWRFLCVNLTFLVMGMNDACVGVSLNIRLIFNFHTVMLTMWFRL